MLDLTEFFFGGPLVFFLSGMRCSPAHLSLGYTIFPLSISKGSRDGFGPLKYSRASQRLGPKQALGNRKQIYVAVFLMAGRKAPQPH